MNKAAAFKPDAWITPMSGDYLKDCDAGEALAKRLLVHMRERRSPVFLGWLLKHMVETNQVIASDGGANGVFIGLCGAIADHAMRTSSITLAGLRGA